MTNARQARKLDLGLINDAVFLKEKWGRRDAAAPRRPSTWSEIHCIAQAHKLGDRPDAHLLHHAGAVHLYRFFRRSEISGDLLVETSGDDMRQDLALAPLQGSQPALVRLALRPRTTCQTIFFKRLANRSEKLRASPNGLVRKFTAPAFIARTPIGMSP